MWAGPGPGRSDWEYAVNFRHETKDGTKRTAGAFFVNSAQLVEPVDYVTDQVDASASYTGTQIAGEVRLLRLDVQQQQRRLDLAESVYRAGSPGAIAGQLALAPDNQFHQILGLGGIPVQRPDAAHAPTSPVAA